MKIRYVGETFGVALTDGVVYECLGVEDGGGFRIMLRVIDDSEEDYLYSVLNPAPLDGSSPGGKWEIVEDDENNTLSKLFYSIKRSKHRLY